jgi:hypothetical protein
MRNNKLFVILFLVVVAVFFLGVVNLFKIRFQSGDIYPVYSSLRSDPLGTKVMFEGLNHMRGVSSVRNYHPLYKIRHDPETTYLFLGMHTKNFIAFNKKDAEKLESILTDGGRIAMTVLPGRKPGKKCNTKREESCDTIHENEQDTAGDNENIYDKANIDQDKDGPASYVNLAEQWGVALEYHNSSAASDGSGYSNSLLITNRYNLPDTMSWHSQFYFRIIDNEWNEIYAIEGRPVLIERDFAHGKIILSTDTYFASNEAMLKERHPDLLSWIIGENRRVLFDETHLGIVEQPNLAALARKYRLHGLFAGFLFLAALFIWKNSTSFVPPDKNNEEESVQESSKDYLSGLVNLLQRNIKSDDIMDVCFHEWAKTPGQQCHAANDLKQIKEIVERDKKTPVNQNNSLKSYKSIRQTLDKRRYI